MLVWRIVRVARWQAEEEDRSARRVFHRPQLSAMGFDDRAGDPRRQTRLGAGGQLLHEGRHRRGQAGLNMADTLKLKIVTPEGKAWSGPVEMVTLTGLDS